MSFASKVHEEKHVVLHQGKEYLLDIWTTKFVGFNLITQVICSRKVMDCIDMFEHKSSKDFKMTLQSDYSGRITHSMIENHIQHVKENLSNIKNDMLLFYTA